MKVSIARPDSACGVNAIAPTVKSKKTHLTPRLHRDAWIFLSTRSESPRPTSDARAEPCGARCAPTRVKKRQSVTRWIVEPTTADMMAASPTSRADAIMSRRRPEGHPPVGRARCRLVVWDRKKGRSYDLSITQAREKSTSSNPFEAGLLYNFDPKTLCSSGQTS